MANNHKFSPAYTTSSNPADKSELELYLFPADKVSVYLKPVGVNRSSFVFWNLSMFATFFLLLTIL